jgi:hypothetical protein
MAIPKTSSKTVPSKRGKTKPNPRPLNVRQERFCELVASGKSGTDAWLEAGYNVSREVARTNAAESLANPRIEARVAQLRAPQTVAALLSKEEKLAFLASIVRTPVGEIGPDSPLCSEYTEEFVGGGDAGRLRRGNKDSGNQRTTDSVLRVRVKAQDKLRALELHSKLTGDFEAEKHVIDAGPDFLETMRERSLHIAKVLSLAP